jgi:diadenylate cyclase
LEALFDALTATLGRLDARAVLDILLVAAVIYAILLLLRGSTAMSLLRGIAFILLGVLIIGYFLQLTVVNYLLRNVLIVLGFAIPVIFQPEIRRALERVGRTTFGGAEAGAVEHTVETVARTAMLLSERRHGALLALERETGLQEIIDTGVAMDAQLSVGLLTSIFYPKSELHDGAVVIRNGRIAAAACILPLGARPPEELALGTRHRAALGVTEERDTICVVVSEVSGTISLAHNGRLIRGLDGPRLQRLLANLMGVKPRGGPTFRKGKKGD